MTKIAILYQANPAPEINGVIKPMKKGGYVDSGADLAYALYKQELDIIPFNPSPEEHVDTDWVFPDTEEGIEKALLKKVDMLWLNTVLYKGHPIMKFLDKGINIVGQHPEMVENFDDKWVTNNLLKRNGIPIPKSFIIKKDNYQIDEINISFPAVVKPIRGRGSQGVSKVNNIVELEFRLHQLFTSNLYGNSVYVESFLSGTEITITVMPPGTYYFSENETTYKRHWCLPVVHRFNHKNGIAPYSGNVAVVHNSMVLSPKDHKTANIQNAIRNCEKAATLLSPRAPIRIDCRADNYGNYFLFDINLKPNMTGNIRSGRTDQNSLSSMAAAALGWSYTAFVRNMLNQHWAL